MFDCEYSLINFKNSFAFSVLGIDGFTISAMVMRIMFKDNLLDICQASQSFFFYYIGPHVGWGHFVRPEKIK